MNTPKATTFNLKTFVKPRKAYQIVLKNVVESDKEKYQLSDKELFYTKTYLRPNQKYPLNTYVDIPMALLNHYAKRQYQISYKIETVDHANLKVIGNLNRLELNSYYKTNYLKPPANVQVDQVTDKYNLVVKILYHKKNKQGRICGEKVQKALKNSVYAYLNKQETLDSYSRNPRSLFTDVLNKTLQKNILTEITENAGFVKAILITNINLND